MHSTGWFFPFHSQESNADVQASLPDISLAGGKGANLARLARAGFPVPEGFIITTAAYRDFVASNSLEEVILAALPSGAGEDMAGLEAASSRIRALFSKARMPERLREEILSEYQRSGGLAVAVRSSATAEDLPEMSFAGQQDTFLNVVGPACLLKAIVDCWSSLWTARAIGYRLRNRLPQSGIALAVIVQEMIESQASGVLFTANPLTGLRTETVIDATLGLGEALVSGQVEPDHYVVDEAGDRILAKNLGAKAISIRSQAGGGTITIEEERRNHQALPDKQILALAKLGKKVAVLYSFPQDIEWALGAGERLYLLQSRPITSLYPMPEGMPPEPLKVMFSFAAVQGMLDPFTPLGQDTMRTISSTGAGLFGVRVTPDTQTALQTAGERLWVNITPLVRNTVGRRAIHFALELVEPAIQQALSAILDDPRLQPERRGIGLQALRRMARFFLPLAGNVLLNLRSPRARRELILSASERVLEEMRARCQAVTGDRYERLARQVNLLPGLARDRLPRTVILFISAVAAGQASFNALRVLAKGLPGAPQSEGARTWSDLVLEVTRGLPFNPTTEMDLALWRAAQTIRADPTSRQEFESYPAAELVRRYQAGQTPAATRTAVDTFLDRYGSRGLCEIDLGRPRWREDPTHVFGAIGSFLQIEDPNLAPDAFFARSAENAQAAIEQLVSALRRTSRGWLKARLARGFAGRVRELMGIRESPKFFAVRMFGMLRRELIRTGEEFAQAGELEQADDLMYLTFSELRAFAARERRDWGAVIAGRRETYRRELLRRQIPRLLLSDGRAFYEGMRAPAGGEKTLSGSPVSPGRAEGRVRVVLDPRQAGLLTGEILVCPGTDPSWTPLFLTAAGLVMEVGGMMTHGAVVAREYGIPAIVGVDQATRRLRTGQRIAIDGSTGLISLLEEPAPLPEEPSEPFSKRQILP